MKAVAALAAALLVVPVTCSPDADPSATARDQQATWDALDVTDYSFSVGMGQGCLAVPVEITVRDGRSVAQSGRSENCVRRVVDMWGVRTIDDLFERLIAVIEGVDDVQVAYDERYGFPSAAVWNRHTPHVMDDEGGMQVFSFSLE